MNTRNAFTLVELMIVVVILAILTMAALPDSDSAIQEEAQRASELFEADVDYARSLTIARPDTPIGIKMSVTANKYWLAPVATPDTPILHPQTGQLYLRQFGTAGPEGLKHVQLAAPNWDADGVLKFDPTGGTTRSTNATASFESGLAVYATQVSPAGNKTVTVSETTDATKLAKKASKQAVSDAAAAAQDAASAKAAQIGSSKSGSGGSGSGSAK
jgi:prepilin-type N-terminal cleavage/methylation domain-containing protein